MARVPEPRLISLQKGHGSEQLAKMPGLAVDLGPELHDLADTAAVVRGLDLVITVDTATRPTPGRGACRCSSVEQALTRFPDWRWLRQREDSPWYPTMRLFRQTVRGQWDEVFRRIRHALNAYLSELGLPVGSRLPWSSPSTAIIIPEDRSVSIQGVLLVHSVAQMFNQALQHHQAGDLRQAESLYRQILQIDPRHVDALHLYGFDCSPGQARNDVAFDYIQQALRLSPDFASAHVNLGLVLRAQGRLAEATSHLERATQTEASDFAAAARQPGGCPARTREPCSPSTISSYRRALPCATRQSRCSQ